MTFFLVIRLVVTPLIMSEISWANVRAMRVVLHLFAAMSGLKVNFHQSVLVWVHVYDYWLNESASIFEL